MTAFYVVPNGPQRSSVFFNGFFSDDGLKSLPPIAALVFKIRPKWASHLFVHNVFDGDSKILRKDLSCMHPCRNVQASTGS